MILEKSEKISYWIISKQKVLISVNNTWTAELKFMEKNNRFMQAEAAVDAVRSC